MQIMRAILVDDEMAANRVLASLLAAYDTIEIVGQYTDPELALKHIDKVEPDVVFLDIEMGRTNGIELANRLTRDRYLQIVFITAYSEYAVEAFEVNAIDYLLKPVQKNRLDKTISKLRVTLLPRQKASPSDSLSERSIHVISLDHVTIYNHEGEPLVWRTRKVRELFLYLWLNPQTPVNRKTLIEQLFPQKDKNKAQVLLHTTVYQLRRCLADIGFPKSIRFANESYSIRVPITSDIKKLESILAQERSDADSIRTILALYKRDFLEEESLDWVMEIQRSIRRKTYNSLTVFAENELEARHYSVLLGDCLAKIRQLDPSDELTARLFLQYYGDQQKITDLKQYYVSYKKLLMQELELKPQPFLEEMYRRYMP